MKGNNFFKLLVLLLTTIFLTYFCASILKFLVEFSVLGLAPAATQATLYKAFSNFVFAYALLLPASYIIIGKTVNKSFNIPISQILLTLFLAGIVSTLFIFAKDEIGLERLVNNQEVTQEISILESETAEDIEYIYPASWSAPTVTYSDTSKKIVFEKGLTIELLTNTNPENYIQSNITDSIDVNVVDLTYLPAKTYTVTLGKSTKFHTYVMPMVGGNSIYKTIVASYTEYPGELDDAKTILNVINSIKVSSEI